MHSQGLCFSRKIDLDLASLLRLTEDMESFGIANEIPEDVRNLMSLGLEEIATNAMKYGYKDGRRGSVEVRTTLSRGVVRLEIGDDGDPFDPTVSPQPDLQCSIEARAVGGLGLHLVRNLMDTFSYERKNELNVVTLTKHF